MVGWVCGFLFVFKFHTLDPFTSASDLHMVFLNQALPAALTVN